MATCSVYKAGGRLLGTGSISSGATSLTGWSAAAGNPSIARRNVIVTITSSTHAGSSFATKVMVEGASLTLRDPSPFAT